MSSHLRTLALFLPALCLLPAHASAQAKREADAPKVFCEPSRALALVGEQLSEAKAFADPVKRIGVMTRAAGVLWPHERSQARAVFTEAFELASRHFREHGDEVRNMPVPAGSRLSGLTVQLPDQRFVVLHAIAKRDAAWARELAARAAEETREEAKKDKAAGGEQHRSVGGKLLSFAERLLETDPQAAYSVARSTFADPATSYLALFLYRVAGSDRAAADALFRDALAAYAGRDVSSLMHLSQYPFALNTTIGPVTFYIGMAPPAGFAADPELQRLYVNTFLGLAERRLATLAQQPPAEGPPYTPAEAEVIYAALKALETLYGARQPAALERITALQAQAVTLLSPASQGNAADYSKREPDGGEAPGEGAFAAAIEQAAKAPLESRDYLIASAITRQSAAETLEAVEAAAQKIEEAEARREVLNWLYFSRAQKAASAGELDEARKLAERVEALEERALLFLNIAQEGLKRSDDKQRAEGLLTSVVNAARKAPDTLEKARALLGVAHLYARFDYLRGLEVMGDVVGTVNKLNDPDLGMATLMRVIRGKDFSVMMGHPMPGSTVESSFGELGARDFEATLAHAVQLGDKHLRAAAVLALAAKCLEAAEKQPQPKKPAPARGRKQ